MWRAILSYELFLLRLVFLGAVFVGSTLCAEQRSALAFSKEKVLESFFRELFENTTAGYTLYGEKPVDLECIPDRERTIPGTRERRNSVIGGLALKYWENTNPVKTGKYNLIATPYEGGHEILLINRKAFLGAVKQSEPLFEYKMGSSFTPQGLLDMLVSEGFSSLFQENIALQGIVLGYGAENAISYECGSGIKKQLEPKITPPFRLSDGSKTPEEIVQRLKIEKNWAKNEARDLSFYKASEKNDRLKIPFSFLKNSKKSKDLINSYRKYQNSVEAVLKKQSFLAEVLERLGVKAGTERNKVISSNNLESFFSADEKEQLGRLVAQTICNTFPDEISDAFLEGMKATNDDLDESDIRFLDVLWKNGTHCSISTILLNEENIQWLIPNKLCFRTLKASDSEKALTMLHNKVQVHYLFKDFEDNSLVGSYQLQEAPVVELANMIPGFSYGLLGMKEGEIREVFIHPDFIYGTTSNFGKSQAIKVIVELVRLEETTEQTLFPPLKPADVANYAPNIFSCTTFNDLQRKHAYACGLRSWRYYKKASPFITLSTVLDKIQSEPKRPLSESESALLLKFEWLIQQM
jgi:hypothetical protein